MLGGLWYENGGSVGFGWGASMRSLSRESFFGRRCKSSEFLFLEVVKVQKLEVLGRGHGSWR